MKKLTVAEFTFADGVHHINETLGGFAEIGVLAPGRDDLTRGNERRNFKKAHGLSGGAAPGECFSPALASISAAIGDSLSSTMRGETEQREERFQKSR